MSKSASFIKNQKTYLKNYVYLKAFAFSLLNLQNKDPIFSCTD